MSDHLTAEQFESYIQRKLPAAELLMVDDHLTTCEQCRAQLLNASKVGLTVASLREDLRAHATTHGFHLQYEQIAGFLDDKLDKIEREIVQGHLETCAICKEDVRDLSIFKASLSSAEPSSRSAAASIGRKTFLARWPLSFRWSAAAATAAAVIFIAGAWLAWRQKSLPRTEVVQSQPTPAPASSPVTSDTQPPASPEVLLTLNDGDGFITLDNQGNIVGLDALSPPDRRSVKEALTSGRVNVPALGELKGRAEKLLGQPDQSKTFVVTSPVGVVVEANRPIFRWQALAGATGYVVTVYDAGLNEVAASPTLSGTQWKIPNGLPRGAIYTWQVTAIRNEEKIVAPSAPAAEAKFKVLGQAEAAELQRAKRDYSNSHLALGIIYARLGLVSEAKREFQELLRANPDSAVARKLLGSLPR